VEGDNDRSRLEPDQIDRLPMTKVGRFTVWVIVALAVITIGYLTLYQTHR
jgi:hypothetical protein